MNVIFHPELDTELSEYGILIPIKDDRSEKVFEWLIRHGHKLKAFDLTKLSAISESDLRLVHSNEFVSRFMNIEQVEQELIKAYELVSESGEFNRYEPSKAKRKLPEMVPSILKQVAGTLKTCELALEKGFCYFLGGGMHHAMSFGGRGFCPLNDMAIAVEKLMVDQKIKKAWIIDVDAHKGDGTAELFQHDPNVKTLSIHMKRNWPLDGPMYDKEGSLHPWFISSDIDIGIDRGEEALYNKELKKGLERMLSWGKPDLVIVVNGADPFEGDELPSTSALNLTLPQLFDRDMLLYRFFEKQKIPQAYVMAGGYGSRSWEVYAQFLNEVLKLREAKSS